MVKPECLYIIVIYKLKAHLVAGSGEPSTAPQAIANGATRSLPLQALFIPDMPDPIHSRPKSLERQIVDLPFPFAFKAAFGEEHQVFDCRADRVSRTCRENAGHGLTGGDTLEGVAD